MGASSSFAVGKNVIIKECNPISIKELQSTCGGWRLEMIECLSNPSTIEAMQGDILTIKAKSGRSYNINQNLLKVYRSSADAGTLSTLTKLMFFSIQIGELTVAESCIDIIGTKETIENCYPLEYAAQEGKLEIVKLLIRKRASVNASDDNGTTALHMAVCKMHSAICKVLLDNGADVNKQNKDSLTPLMMAVISKNEYIVQLLAGARNINFNLGDKDKDTALHLAVHLSEIRSVEILLLNGASVEPVNKNNLTAFHWAAAIGNERVLEIFLKIKPFIADQQDENKFTALHIATIKDHVECVRTLVRFKADKNIVNIIQQTPLHVAIAQSNWECAKILIDSGADLNKKDIKGDIPLHIAMVLLLKYDTIGALFGIINVLVQPKGAAELETIITNMVQRGARLDTENLFGITPVEMCMNLTLKAKLLDIQKKQERQLVIRVSQSRDNDELRRVIRQMVEEDNCTNCNIRKKTTIFTCSHMSCDECAQTVSSCFTCGKSIIQKIQLKYNY